jgi:hypothetical protein
MTVRFLSCWVQKCELCVPPPNTLKPTFLVSSGGDGFCSSTTTGFSRCAGGGTKTGFSTAGFSTAAGLSKAGFSGRSKAGFSKVGFSNAGFSGLSKMGFSGRSIAGFSGRSIAGFSGRSGSLTFSVVGDLRGLVGGALAVRPIDKGRGFAGGLSFLTYRHNYPWLKLNQF